MTQTYTNISGINELSKASLKELHIQISGFIGDIAFETTSEVERGAVFAILNEVSTELQNRINNVSRTAKTNFIEKSGFGVDVINEQAESNESTTFEQIDEDCEYVKNLNFKKLDNFGESLYQSNKELTWLTQDFDERNFRSFIHHIAEARLQINKIKDLSREYGNSNLFALNRIEESIDTMFNGRDPEEIINTIGREHVQQQIIQAISTRDFLYNLSDELRYNLNNVEEMKDNVHQILFQQNEKIKENLYQMGFTKVNYMQVDRVMDEFKERITEYIKEDLDKIRQKETEKEQNKKIQEEKNMIENNEFENETESPVFKNNEEYEDLPMTNEYEDVIRPLENSSQFKDFDNDDVKSSNITVPKVEMKDNEQILENNNVLETNVIKTQNKEETIIIGDMTMKFTINEKGEILESMDVFGTGEFTPSKQVSKEEYSALKKASVEYNNEKEKENEIEETQNLNQDTFER